MGGRIHHKVTKNAKIAQKEENEGTIPLCFLCVLCDFVVNPAIIRLERPPGARAMPRGRSCDAEATRRGRALHGKVELLYSFNLKVL